MNKLILSLGGNQGDVKDTFHKAEQLISDEIGLITKTSSNYKTAAWGNTHQPDFLNKVIEVTTESSVDDCLQKVLSIEKRLGRIRTEKKWEERTIDIDILFYNDLIIHQENLIVPHPYIQDRKFVLIPLVEMIPDHMHPVFKHSIKKLLQHCTDDLEIKKLLKN